MAAPAYVQKVTDSASGVSSKTVTLTDPSVAGHLLYLSVGTGSGQRVATPAGWTREVNYEATDGGAGDPTSVRHHYVFWKQSTSDTGVTVEFRDSTDSFATNAIAGDIHLLEYDLTFPALFASHATRQQDDHGPPDGYGAHPGLSYPAGPIVIVGSMEMEGGPQGGDSLSTSAGFTLRTPASSGTATKKTAVSDMLLDGSSGSVPDYPDAAGWYVFFTDIQSLTAASMVFEEGTADPTSGVVIDWGDDGFAIGSDDEISENVVHWIINRGASAEITGGANPGTCTLTLKNPSDIYNPRNASSPLYGMLLDGRPVWVGVNSDGKLTGTDPRGLFGGRTKDITLLPSGGADESPLVEITCEDPLGWYQRTPVQVDYAEGRAHDALRLAALQAAGETRYDLAHEIHTMPLSHADGNLLDVLERINAVNGSRHFAKPADLYVDWYTYTTRNRQWRLDATVDASVDAGSEHVTDTSGWRQSAETVINQQTATVTPITFTPGTFTVWEADKLPIGVTDVRPYSRIVDFDDVVRDPVLDIASTGDTVTSTLTPFASAAKIELSVGAGDAATITRLSVEGRLLRRLPDEGHVADNTTSQALPRGIRAGSEIGNEYLGVIASARGIAEHVVWRFGDPQFRPTLTIHNWFPEQFELDLYDTISFTSAQLGITDLLFEIVGLTHEGDIAADDVQHHITTYVLQECKVQSDPGWFYLDDDPGSLLDDTAVLAY